MTSHTSHTGIARSLNCDGRYLAALLLCLAALLGPAVGGEPLQLDLRYERSAVAQGQWWRLLTAHFVHIDLTHALLNGVGLVLLWALFARSYRPTQWLLALALTIVVIDLGFWFLSPALRWYVGASAVLHGIFACGCIALLRQRDPIGMIAAVIFVGKLVWEQLSGPLPFADGHAVVTVSHTYGALGGLLAGLLLRGRTEPLY